MNINALLSIIYIFEILKWRIKKKNNKLKNYIEKTFEVIKNIFSFPIDKFKCIVNNFIQYFDK